MQVRATLSEPESLSLSDEPRWPAKDIPNNAKWIQFSANLRNPFMGQEMLGMRRGSEVTANAVMINRLIEWSLRNRFLVACATLFVIALGVHALSQTRRSMRFRT